MRPEGVAAAIREFKRTQRAWKRIAKAATVEDAEDAWAEFLTHANKIYTKLKAACYGHPRDYGWYGKKLDERSSDPLLLYIHKARNCDTHRLEPIITSDRKPLPVIDKGVVYQVPEFHGGYEIEDPSCVTIGYWAVVYLQDLVMEADSRLR
jgi:hypothetical protein